MAFVILAVIWAVVLLQPLLRVRAEGKSADSIVSFRRQMRIIQRTRPMAPPTAWGGTEGGRYPHPAAVASIGASQAVPLHPARGDRRARTMRRRREVFSRLLVGMAVTLVLSMLLGAAALWLLHIVIDALFVGYVALLVRMRNIATEKEMKLRFLPTPPARPQPLLLRRTVN